MGDIFEQNKEKYRDLIVRRTELEIQIVRNLHNPLIVSELRSEYRKLIDELEETMDQLIKMTNGKEVPFEKEDRTIN